MTMPRRCLDCEKEGINTRRKATKTRQNEPYLCATHRRARRSSRRDYSWERHLLETYGLSVDEYWQMYDAQNGRCYICNRPRRRDAKKLSVDHCHRTGRLRGLLDQKCNRDVLGHFRDDPESFIRGHRYLLSPPAFSVIGERVVPGFVPSE